MERAILSLSERLLGLFQVESGSKKGFESVLALNFAAS